MAYQIPDESGTTPLALANHAHSGLGQWTHTKVCADMSMQKKKKCGRTSPSQLLSLVNICYCLSDPRVKDDITPMTCIVTIEMRVGLDLISTEGRV